MPADAELAEYLEDEGVFTVGATNGTGIFVGEMPAGVVNAAVITMYPGAPGEHVLGTVGWSIEMPRLQLKVRNESEATAISKAQSAARALAKIANQVIEGVRYRSVTVLQAPGIIDRDANNRPIYGFNCEAERTATS